MTIEQDAAIVTEHLHRYLFALNYCIGQEVLDLACGEGYGSQILAEKALNVTGIDIDPEIILYATKKYRAGNLRFLEGNAESLPVTDQSVDVVVSFETLEHVPSQDGMLAEIKRVLKPGGLLIISTPDRKFYSEETGHHNPFHLKELFPDEFRSLLEKYFHPVRLLFQYVQGSSVIYPTDKKDVQWYGEGDIGYYFTRNTIPAKYMIALAGCETNIPGLSIFNGKNIVDRIHGGELETVLKSRTYRLGKAIMAPYQWLRRLFQSNHQ